MITNYHVITDASEIQVTFMGGTEYSAKVVGFDQDKDIAVLQVGTQTQPWSEEGSVTSGYGHGSYC